MRQPAQYVSKAIDGLRLYMGRRMPAVSVSVFIRTADGKARVRTMLTDCVLSHDPKANGVSEADVASAQSVVALRVMRGTAGGWNMAEPPKVGDEFEIDGTRYTAEWVDWWTLGWKVRLAAGVQVPK